MHEEDQFVCTEQIFEELRASAEWKDSFLPTIYTKEVGKYLMDLINTKSKGVLARLFKYLKEESLFNLQTCTE